jgi:hypothetical protein
MARKTRAAAVVAMPLVKMEGDGVEEEDIHFVDCFEYLGFHFESGGDRWHHVEIRMAMAASAFGRLRHIWADSRLSRRLKLRIYSTYIDHRVCADVGAAGDCAHDVLCRLWWPSPESPPCIVEIPYVPQSRHRLYLEKFCRKLTFCW